MPTADELLDAADPFTPWSGPKVGGVGAPTSASPPPPPPAARSPTADEMLDAAGSAPAPPAAGGYMTNAEFRSRMDQTFGSGNWTDTGDYRTQAREDELRRQGAMTVRPGHISQHTLGTPDAPGGHDIVVRGMSAFDAGQRLSGQGPWATLFPEGAHGGQGSHLHIGMAQQTPPAPPPAQPSADQLLDAAAPPPSPASPAAAVTGATPPPKPPAAAVKKGALAMAPPVANETVAQRNARQSVWGQIADAADFLPNLLHSIPGPTPPTPQQAAAIDAADRQAMLTNPLMAQVGHAIDYVGGQRPGTAMTAQRGQGLEAIGKMAQAATTDLPNTIADWAQNAFNPLPGVYRDPAGLMAQTRVPPATTPAAVDRMLDEAKSLETPPGLSTTIGGTSGGIAPYVLSEAAGPAAPFVGAGMMGLSGAAAEADRAKELGLEGTDEASAAILGNAGWQAATGFLPFGFLQKFTPELRAPVAKLLAKSGFNMATGAATGTAMGVGQNLIEGATIDPGKSAGADLGAQATQMAALNTVLGLLHGHATPDQARRVLADQTAKADAAKPAAPIGPMPDTSAIRQYAGVPPDTAPPTPQARPAPVAPEPVPEAPAAETPVSEPPAAPPSRVDQLLDAAVPPTPEAPTPEPPAPEAPDQSGERMRRMIEGADKAPEGAPKPGDDIAFYDPDGREKIGTYDQDIGDGFHRVSEPNGTQHEIPTDDIVGHTPPPDDLKATIDRAMGGSTPERPAPTVPTTPTETPRGIQGTLPPVDAGERPGHVPIPGQERPDGGAPPGEVGGGARAPEGPVGGRAEGTERPGAGPDRTEPGRGEGAPPVDRVPGAGAEPPRGDERHASPPDQEPAGGPEDHTILPGGVAEERGPAQKARDNLEAIRIAKDVEARGTPATPDERDTMAKYVGWGGLPGAFVHPQTGTYGKGFEKVGPELKALLTPEEYATAARSTQYAHYTAEHVIRSMWKTAQDMGFKGGDVFEPGMGVGHFKGMAPPELASRIKYHGLEMDAVTAKIAKALYPKSTVREADYTKTALPDDAFDLVIGNPPFSDTPIRADEKYPQKFMLHDYFFAKSMDKLRPGGLMAFVTSAGTMNKMDAKARHYLAERSEFVGGARLPSSAFRKNAGTDVTTDVLFFKKRPEKVKLSDADHEHWTQSANRVLPDAQGAPGHAPVNRYFTEHPEQVLGKEGRFDKLHEGRYAVHAPEGQDLPAELAAALDRLPKNILGAANEARQAARDFEAPETKDGSFYSGKDGRLMQYSDGVGRPVGPRGTDGGRTKDEVERIKRMLPLRDAYRDALEADYKGDAAGSAKARQDMNTHYDAFVAKHGPINKAVFKFSRPNVIQQESARAAAREEARDRGEPWREGDFDAETMTRSDAKLADIAKLRQQAREDAAAKGIPFDEGSFNPADMEDAVRVTKPNFDPFQDDPSSYQLSAIEKYNDDTGEAQKGPAFYGDVTAKQPTPQLDSAHDGALWSLNQFGKLDIDRIASQMGRTPESIINDLGDSLYKTPGGEYQPADEYLSGDILDKLAVARAAAERDPSLERNVKALEEAKPKPIPPNQITITLGMPWIPQEEITAFARDALGIGQVKATHNRALGGWRVDRSNFQGPGEAQYATPEKTASEVLSMALNRDKAQVRVAIPDEYGRPSGRTVVDETATQALQDKIEAMKAAWTHFVQEPERSERLADLYNNKMNRVTLRKFVGDYLTTPGIAVGQALRAHQKRVVARIIQSGNTYMAHAVGAGKTMAMIASGMEMRRLGLVKKPMYVVPNHMLGQFTKEFYELYPNAKIAVADDRRFHTSRRKQFMANVANEDLDAVIITHSSFGKIPTRPETQRDLIQKELDRVLEAMGDPKALDRFTRKDLEAKKEALEQRMEGAFKGKKKDTQYAFEQMGVDHLFVDEAHLFRKLEFATRQRGLKGIDPEGSQRAWDLYSKIHYLESRNPGRSAVLASGTPITNTMGELYSLSRYMQPQALEDLGIGHFDSWAATFGDQRSNLEQTAQGTYEPVTRFAQFLNIPELYKTVGQVMDVVTGEELGALVPRPKLKGGERQFHLAPETDWLKDFQQSLASRAEAIKNRSGPAQKGDDIILSIINDGRHSAIDPRMVDQYAGDTHPSKLNTMLKNVAEIYHRTTDTQFYDPNSGYKTPTERGPATQMIFADLGVNATAKRPFSGYAWMKRSLIAQGVKPKEIAFIGDYKNPVAKQRLFNDMNTGKIRVLIGSVDKMGVGTNAQRRLIALHNQDPLWFPANDEQRLGRILRQGNQNPEIEVHDYSTKGTYDATMWQAMGRKGRFIEQFFRGDPNLRNMEDLGEAGVFEQLSAMTTSDPRLIELTNMRQELDRAQRRRDAHESEQYALRGRVKDAQSEIERAGVRSETIAKDIARRTPTRAEAFTMDVGGKKLTKRGDAAAALREKVDAVLPGLEAYERAKVGELGGFPVFVRKMIAGETEFEMQRSDGNYATLGNKASSTEGVIQSMENRLHGLEGEAADQELRKQRSEAVITSANAQIGKAFEGGPEIADLKGKIGELEGQLTPPKEGPPAGVAKDIEDLKAATSGRQMQSGVDPMLAVKAARVAGHYAQKGIDHILGTGGEYVGRKLTQAADRFASEGMKEFGHNAMKAIRPLATGSKRAQVAAHEFITHLRASRLQWGAVDRWLESHYTPDERKLMWDAADEEGTMRRSGHVPGPNEGLNRLNPKMRGAVDELQARALDAFERAKKLDMTRADALESYTPRMIVRLSQDGAQRVGGIKGAQGQGDLSKTTGGLRHRKYLTTAETEAAAQAHFGADVHVVRDIRTLALATSKLEEAIAGRTLIEKIKEVGRNTGVSLVQKGGTTDPANFFTHPHPAFKIHRPQFTTDPATGKTVQAIDQAGNKIWKQEDVHVHKEFEGPLKAVLQKPTGPLYNALMTFNSKMMGAIMYSPAMHNAVIWGKALPAAPLGMLQPFRKYSPYYIGKEARKDPDQVRTMALAGMVPPGRNFAMDSLTDIAGGKKDVAPGKSWTAQALAFGPGIVDRFAGTNMADAVKRGVDKAGHFWHQTLLWDNIANLQAGLFKMIAEKEIKKGMDPVAANKIAAHFANLYAGSLPVEAMSREARMVGNMGLFSRSFTGTNLGGFKAMVTGLPPEMRAAIEAHGGEKLLTQAQGVARRKAIGMVMMDVAVGKMSLVAAAAAMYFLHKALGQNEPLQWPWDNEKGKEDRFLIGHDHNGAAIFGRAPTGKVGEELQNWPTRPISTFNAKLSPMIQIAEGVRTNNQGFDRKIYDPYDKTPAGQLKNAGRIAWYAAQHAGPGSELAAIGDLAGDVTSGHGDVGTDAMRAILPPLGLTTSSGGPGGEAMGELRDAREEHEFQLQERAHDIRRELLSGDPDQVAKARAELTSLGITGRDQSNYVNAARNPHVSRGAQRRFNAYASPEEKARFSAARARDAAHVPAPTATGY